MLRIRVLLAILALKFDGFKQLSKLLADLKVEHFKLHHNIDQLNNKVANLKSSKIHLT